MKKSLIVSLIVAGAFFAAPVIAQDGGHYRAAPLGSKVRIDGSANVHDWHMDGTLIGGTFELPEGVTLDSTKADVGGLKGDKLDAKASVRIPVNSVQSGTEGMDSVMQQAMNQPTYPAIIYKLNSLTFKGPHTANTPFQFDAKGDLSLNGVTNQITMPVTIESAEKGKLKIIGSVPLKMTAFKVPPPVKLGLFTTKDDVKISFEWLVAPAKAAK